MRRIAVLTRYVVACSLAWVQLVCTSNGIVFAKESSLRSGIVVDDESAEYQGQWVRKATRSAFVGKTYHYDDIKDSGSKSARFVPELPKSGQYEVRVIYVPHANRATNAAVEVFSEEGKQVQRLNQRENPFSRGIPRSVGTYQFASGRAGAVVVSTAGADGFVVVDAVQFVPVAVAKKEQAAVAGVLAQPRRVRHTASSPAHLRVEWDDAANDETGYRIWRREAGGNWYLAGETGADSTHFDDGGMQQLTAYEHKVAAFNDAEEGPATTTAAATRTAAMSPHLESEILVPANGTTYSKDPAAIVLKSGELLLSTCVANVKKRRSFQDTSVHIGDSRNGRSDWSNQRKLLSGDSQVAYGKPALVRISDDKIGLNFTRFSLDDKGLIIGRERRHIFSTDEGKTWSEPIVIGPNSANNQTLIVGAQNRLLEALSGLTGINEIFTSDDSGATWQSRGLVPGKELGEAALAHMGDGHIVFLSRHEFPFYKVSHSADNGLSWEKKESRLYLGGGDNPPKLVRLPDSDILVAIVHSWYPGTKQKDRRQLASLISRDGGRTWDNFRLIGFAPKGDDGFLQHSITFVGDTAFVFFGGGSKNDTGDGSDLRLIKLSKDFFTSTTPWPYDWQGRPLTQRRN